MSRWNRAGIELWCIVSCGKLYVKNTKYSKYMKSRKLFFIVIPNNTQCIWHKMIERKFSIKFWFGVYKIFMVFSTYLQLRRCVPSAIWFTRAIWYTYTARKYCRESLNILRGFYDNFTTWEFFFKKIWIWSVWKFEDWRHTDPFTHIFAGTTCDVTIGLYVN